MSLITCFLQFASTGSSRNSSPCSLFSYSFHVRQFPVISSLFLPPLLASSLPFPTCPPDGLRPFHLSQSPDISHPASPSCPAVTSILPFPHDLLQPHTHLLPLSLTRPAAPCIFSLLLCVLASHPHVLCTLNPSLLPPGPVSTCLRSSLPHSCCPVDSVLHLLGRARELMCVYFGSKPLSVCCQPALSAFGSIPTWELFVKVATLTLYCKQG